MAARIANGTRTAYVSYQVEVAIGFHTCPVCDTETPEPSQALLDQLVRDGHRGTVWPFESWTPPGWARIIGDGSLSIGWVCDGCASAVNSLLATRKRIL